MLAPLILRLPDEDGFVLFEEQALRVIAEHRQRVPDASEAGGILLGYRRGPHLHVTDATAPLDTDSASRTRFFRSAAPHHNVALTRWHESGGNMDYMGEWHTHPEHGPSPSTMDTQGWQHICGVRKVPMLFVIAGTEDCLWIGLGCGGSRRIVELH